MKKLLIVVDYQKDFVSGSLGFKKAQDLENYISDLIEKYHKEGHDVLFTLDTHDKNYMESQEGKNLPIVHCIKGSDGWNLYGKVNEVKQIQDKCIEKKTFGSLELGNYLIDKIYEDITLVGVVSNICVLSNAIIVKSALPETPIYIDLKGIASNDSSLESKTIDLLKNLQFHVINE